MRHIHSKHLQIEKFGKTLHYKTHPNVQQREQQQMTKRKQKNSDTSHLIFKSTQSSLLGKKK